MKILHIITGLETGGAENALLNILQGGLAKQHSNTVISLNGLGTVGPKIRTLGVDVLDINMKSRIPKIANLRAIKNITQEINPDVIQGWMYHGNLAAQYASKHSSEECRTIWNVRHSLYDLKHEKLFTRQIIRMNKLLSKKPDAIIYNSKVSKKQHEKFGFCSKQGRVIPNGVSLDLFTRSNDVRVQERKTLQISEDSIVIGHVARLHPIKDHENFLRAVTKILNQFENVEIIMIGPGVTEDASNVSKYKDDRIHMLGERDDVCNLMNTMDIFCLSSKSEAFPNVLIEAMSLGIVCVATDVGDSRYILDETGIVVPPEDEHLLHDGLHKMIECGSEELRNRGLGARCRVEKYFSIHTTVKKYINLYEALLHEGAR